MITFRFRRSMQLPNVVDGLRGFGCRLVFRDQQLIIVRQETS